MTVEMQICCQPAGYARDKPHKVEVSSLAPAGWMMPKLATGWWRMKLYGQQLDDRQTSHLTVEM